jgi:hypothetical protein
MKQDWQELTRLTKGEEITVERVRLDKKGTAIEGQFELPALSRLTIEDQMFVIAFIRCHGSIKEMESLFGISYPTVKNRLDRIARQLEFVEINPPLTKADILGQLERGEISVDEAEKQLRRENDTAAG